jgi:hypothetical protein
LSGRADEADRKSQKKGKSLPSSRKIHEYVRNILQKQVDSKNPMPRYFEAALIKWTIYERKMEQQARSAMEFEAEADRNREFLAMKQETGKVNGIPERSAKGFEVKSTSEPRPNSRLRRRDEEWKNKMYIDDAPADGGLCFFPSSAFDVADLRLALRRELGEL